MEGTNEQAYNIFEGDPLLGWRLKPNLDQVWWNFTTISTNHLHMRYMSLPKGPSKNRLRILCLGDSVTFGFQVPLSWPKTPYNYDYSALPSFIRTQNPGIVPGETG